MQITYNKLLHHKAVGSWPLQLMGLHEPSFGLSKEFKDTQPILVAEMSQRYAEFRGQMLDMAIQLKDQERGWLANSLLISNYLPPMLDIIHATYLGLKEQYKQPLFEETPIAPGELRIVGWNSTCRNGRMTSLLTTERT
jgi:hypothetical protein